MLNLMLNLVLDSMLNSMLNFDAESGIVTGTGFIIGVALRVMFFSSWTVFVQFRFNVVRCIRFGIMHVLP